MSACKHIAGNMRSLLMDDEVRYISGPLLQQLDQDLQECERQSLLRLTANICSHHLWIYLTILHTRACTRLTALFPGLPRWAGTGKVKSIWILLKQEMVSGSGISWAICKSAPCCRQTTIPALSFLQLDQDLQECERQSLLCLTANNHTSTQFFTGQMPFLLPNQQRQSISYSFNGAVYLQCICLQCFDTVGWSSWIWFSQNFFACIFFGFNTQLITGILFAYALSCEWNMPYLCWCQDLLTQILSAVLTVTRFGLHLPTCVR